MDFNWTAHAIDRSAFHMPSLPHDQVDACIRKACISIPADWRASGGWQRKEFVLFWADSRPWVAIIDLASRNLLSIIHAWIPNIGGGHGAELYEWVEGKKTVVCTVRRHQVRRAIRLLDDGTEVPPHFRNQDYALTARVCLSSGRVRVTRLGRETIQDDPKLVLQDEQFLAKCKEKLFAIFPENELRHAVLILADGRHVEEVELVEQICSGGW